MEIFEFSNIKCKKYLEEKKRGLLASTAKASFINLKNMSKKIFNYLYIKKRKKKKPTHFY